jgi:glycosyltransferase involved in cell wall biosynthesis
MTCAKRHKILILDNSLDMGGVEKKLFDLIPRFDPDHFEVIVCCLKAGGYYKQPLIDRGVRVYDGLLSHKYNLFAYKRLGRIIRDERIELIYTFLHPNTVLFSYLSRVTGRVKAWVVSIHATGSPAGGTLVKPYLKPFLGRVDRFIAVAHAHGDYLAEVEGLPRERMEVIHNGVDAGLYCPGAPDPALRAALAIPEGARVVATIASLKPAKCIDILLQAAARVAEKLPDTYFLIIGDGPDRGLLQEMAAGLGLGDKVLFAGIRDDVYDLLRLSSLFVLPSKKGTETFPNVVLEAMATGLPVVSTDVGSVREMAEAGVSAYIVQPQQTEALAGAMIDLLSDPEKMSSFGRRGRAIVMERFTLDLMRSRREQLFKTLLCETAASNAPHE